MVLGWVDLRQSDIPKLHLQAQFALVCGLIHFSSISPTMDDDVPHRIDKLHKVEACFGIPVTTWSGKPLTINGIGHGRVSCKDGGTNSLAPSVVGIRYTVAIGIGNLIM